MPFVPDFRPSTRAPLFKNGPWPSDLELLTLKVPPLPPQTVSAVEMGLCGGMSFIARDIYEAGSAQLRSADSRSIPLALAQQVLHRLVESFDGGPVVERWLRDTAALDHDTQVFGPGLFRRTLDECDGITADVDAGVLSPIGLILKRSSAPWDVFKNHVVLVWKYERDGELLRLFTYDCNYPGDDEAVITIDTSSPSPAKPIATTGTSMRGPNGDHLGTVRGFFRLPYTFRDPSALYIDSGEVSIYLAPPTRMLYGEKATAIVQVHNWGTTSWSRTDGYCLDGLAKPEWGLGAADIPGRIDPQQSQLVFVQLRAPATAGIHELRWQLLKDPGKPFGQRSRPVEITVAGHHETAVVPEVVGFTRGAAEQAILRAGLKAVVKGQTLPRTIVESQSPTGGMPVRAGSEVTINLKSDGRIPDP